MNSHMIVFNKYVMPMVVETLAQRVALFNQASNGTIVLTTAGFTGDFLQESFWKSVAGAQRRVDRYAANGNVAATNLEQGKKSTVKVAGGFGPVLFEPAQLTWLEKPTAEGIEVISRSLADALLSDQLNTAIAALVAAIGNQATVVNDVSATAGLSYIAMNAAHAKFGDASASLAASVMSGASAHKLIAANLANGANLFKSDSVNVIDILGRPVVITDAAALTAAGAPNKCKVLSLASQAAVVMDGGDLIANISTTNGKDRIETTMQADYSFGVNLKGYSWDETNGGKTPTNAELATGTNWDLVAASVKHTAGVLTIADADQ